TTLFRSVTAQYLMQEYRAIKPGDFVLIHAAAGGVGQVLVQWAKHVGAIVIATASSAKKLETARSLGADYVVNYAETDFVAAVKDITRGAGGEIAFDALGRTTLVKTIEAVAARGTAVTYGSASGVAPAIEPRTLISQAKRLAGGAIFAYTT